MGQKLNDRIKLLENEIRNLKAKVSDLATKTEAGRIKPESKVPKIDLSRQTPMPSTGTGLGKLPARAGNIIFNDGDAQLKAFGQMPDTPTKGYNKHSHGKFSGGALDINTLELVEYEDLEISGHNKDCQSYWKEQPSIELDEDGNEKISDLSKNMVWDKEEKCWRFIAVYADSEEE